MNDFIVADSGIRQLHAHFVDAVWRQDYAAFANCFANDGEWKIAGMHMKGRDEIRTTSEKLLSRCERIQLIPQNPLLEVDGKTAIGRQSMIEFAKMLDGSSAMTIGLYYDRYVEEDGRWLFGWRHWSMHYRGPADLSAPFVNDVDYGAFPGLPGADEPTYVRKG